jgi:precorrin-4/cobalt-precorrin-4 C11-methyltransferase
MKITFVGAGPGAADLVTVRGARALAEADAVMYAGSLVSRDMLSHCRADAVIFDSSSMDSEAQQEVYRRAAREDWKLVRLHSGDPAIYGAILEQMRFLDEAGWEYEVVPGVSSFTAAAAALKVPLTQAGASQSIIIARTAGRASPVAGDQSIRELSRHGSTMCIFLSGALLSDTVAELLEGYAEETPVALVRKASWPEEEMHRSTLAGLRDCPPAGDWRLSTMMIVGDVVAGTQVMASRLYDPEYGHRFRKARKI